MEKIAFLFKDNYGGDFRIDATPDDVIECSKIIYDCYKRQLNVNELSGIVVEGFKDNLHCKADYQQTMGCSCLAYIDKTESYKKLKQFGMTGMIVTITFYGNKRATVEPGCLTRYQDVENLKSITDKTPFL